MATHSSVLAWEIPWTEEPGGLQGHRGRHDLATNSNSKGLCGNHLGRAKSESNPSTPPFSQNICLRPQAPSATHVRSHCGQAHCVLGSSPQGWTIYTGSRPRAATSCAWTCVTGRRLPSPPTTGSLLRTAEACTNSAWEVTTAPQVPGPPSSPQG